MKHSRRWHLPAGLLILAVLIFAISGCLGGGGGSATDLTLVDWGSMLEYGSISGAVFTDVVGTDGRATQPLPGATVRLLTGETTTTDENGEFSFAKPLMGFYRITFSKEGYQTLSGNINILPIDETHINVEMSQSQGEATGAILYLRGIGFVNNDAIWVGVKSISVTDASDPSLSWTREWDPDWYEYPYTLNCHDVIIGHTYNVRVTWGSSIVADKVIDYEVLVENLYQAETFETGDPVPTVENGFITGNVSHEVVQGDETVEEPIEGAMLALGTGDIVFTDTQGNFSFPEVPAGSHLLSVYKEGYHAVGSMVTVEANHETVVNIGLAPITDGGGGTPDPDEAVLHVIAHGYYNANNDWIGVKSIKVSKADNSFDYLWSQTWDYDWYEPSYTLDCHGVTIGTNYRVEIIWGATGYDDETPSIHYVQVTEQDQTVTYEH
ncbi:MAG: carboxypeptidase regulatory-like domain-containing protein [Chloroflexi bacterium]|nr:carboxypeptidase regulatory-like domain-containing protein [Chloroflexota bacterium]